MEKKFGKYAIPHLTRYIIAAYVAGYIISAFGSGNALTYLSLSPSLILKGQVWRLVTWVLIPPSGISIFTVFMLFFYYSIGTQLERAWGDFLYNVYIFSGLILTIIGAFILYAITKPMDYGALFSTYYVSLSLILGYAMTYPNHQILFYFFIPLKMKWLAVIDLAYLAYDLYRFYRYGMLLPGIVIIGCSLANALIFFLATRKNKRIRAAGARSSYRRQNTGGWYTGGPYGHWTGNGGQGAGSNAGQNTQGRGNGSAQGRPGGAGWTMNGPGNANAGNKPIHRCAICGRTEKDNPDLEFRYCTKCKGYYEYCQDHLFTHEHRQ